MNLSATNTFTSFNDSFTLINSSNTNTNNSELNDYYNYLISVGYTLTQALNEVKTYYALRPLYLL